jgi:hypothetical protein
MGKQDLHSRLIFARLPIGVGLGNGTCHISRHLMQTKINLRMAMFEQHCGLKAQADSRTRWPDSDTGSFACRAMLRADAGKQKSYGSADLASCTICELGCGQLIPASWLPKRS